MIVVVQLDSLLQSGTPDGPQRPFEVTLLSGSSLADLVTDLGMALPAAVTFEVNGEPVGARQILQDGDRITVRPPVHTGDA